MLEKCGGCQSLDKCNFFIIRTHVLKPNHLQGFKLFWGPPLNAMGSLRHAHEKLAMSLI